MKSKRLLLCLSVMLAFAAMPLARCQSVITQAQYPSNVVKTIIKEHVYPATISYVETNEWHYFAYSDASMQILNIEIDPDIFVYDIAIHEEYVYFCGLDANTSHGLWGWFKISEFFSSTPTIYTYDGFECNNFSADTLFKLVIYDAESGLHITTVGSSTDGIDDMSCLIDITGTEGLSTGWTYRMGITYCEYPTNYSLTRLCVTDNYVVAAGPTRIAERSELYRIHNRSDVFDPSGPQDDLYLFPAVLGGVDHNGPEIELVQTTGDEMATVSYYYDYFTKKGILVNVYDINQVLTVYACSPVYSYYIYLTNTQSFHACINGMTYSSTLNKLDILLSSQLQYGSGSAIIEMSIPAQVIENLYYTDDNNLTSIDLYNSMGSVVAQGYEMSDPLYCRYYTHSINPNNSCKVNYMVNPINSYHAAKTEYCPYTVCEETFNCNKNQCNYLRLQNEIICH